MDPSNTLYQIKHYEPGKITINDQSYTGSVILTANDLWCIEPRNLSQLQSTHLQLLLDNNDAQIILLGTGRTLIIPPETLLIPFFSHGKGIEFMTSQAACYTYTVLCAEHRKVAACILID
jgi:uncharacterized protein